VVQAEAAEGRPQGDGAAMAEGGGLRQDDDVDMEALEDPGGPSAPPAGPRAPAARPGAPGPSHEIRQIVFLFPPFPPFLPSFLPSSSIPPAPKSHLYGRPLGVSVNRLGDFVLADHQRLRVLEKWPLSSPSCLSLAFKIHRIDFFRSAVRSPYLSLPLKPPDCVSFPPSLTVCVCLRNTHLCMFIIKMESVNIVDVELPERIRTSSSCKGLRCMAEVEAG
jgi:hypothetical protein